MTRKIETPNLIALAELPDSGKNYSYSNESGELDSSLKDITGENVYSVELYVERLGNAYQASGTVKTAMDEVCSRCGADIKLPVDLKVQDILMVQPKMPRSGKNSRVNHSTELDPMAPDCVYLEKPELNVGEFVREAIVLNKPFKPLCSEDCENPYLAKNSKELLESEEAASPFAALKDLKLNS